MINETPKFGGVLAEVLGTDEAQPSPLEKLQSLRINTVERKPQDVKTLCVRSKKELAREVVRLQGLLLQAQRMNNNLINGILDKAAQG